MAFIISVSSIDKLSHLLVKLYFKLYLYIKTIPKFVIYHTLTINKKCSTIIVNFMTMFALVLVCVAQSDKSQTSIYAIA